MLRAKRENDVPWYYAILIPFGIFSASVAYDYGKQIPAAVDKRRRKLLRPTCVYGFWAITSILYGLSAFVHSKAYIITTHKLWGVSLISVVTIPCGLAYFNTPILRPFRTLFFAFLGLANIWTAFHFSA